jgi:serine/threonine protein kinase
VRRDDNQSFAMKVLTKVDLLSSRRNRFSNEIWFCAQSNHPNVVKVLDWGLSAIGGQPFYVLPLTDCSLRKLIDDGIDPAKVPKLLTTALAGVEAAHMASRLEAR